MTSHTALADVPPGADVTHADRLRGVTFDPVFIIGDHRSGTTVLYQLLAGTGAFNVVTAFDVICYDELLHHHLAGTSDDARRALSARFAALGLADRGIDGVAVTPDLPEEYGFIIDYSGRPQLSPRTVDKFVELGRKMRVVGRDRPVLFKNPWDVLTFAYIKQAFPAARFVFVHRHPLHVMNSQLAAVRSLFGERNEYVALLSRWYRDFFTRPVPLAITRAANAERFGIGATIVGRHVLKASGYYLANVDALPSADYVELRYEDLCQDPDATVARVLRFLGRESEQPLALREQMRPRGARVLPDVATRFERLKERLAPYCDRHGYPMELSGPLS